MGTLNFFQVWLLAQELEVPEIKEIIEGKLHLQLKWKAFARRNPELGDQNRP